MSFSRNRAVLAAAALAATTVAVFGQKTPDNNAWKGRLYCLAAWAKNANPEEPKSIQEAFLGATALLPREIPGLQPLTFAVDTGSEEARRWFGQGLACLHLLWGSWLSSLVLTMPIFSNSTSIHVAITAFAA